MLKLLLKYFVVLMMILFIAGLFLFFRSVETVRFADENLEAAIRQEIGNTTEPLRVSDLLVIESLMLRGRGIQSLDNIQFLANLKTIDLRDNQITDISPLAKLKQIQTLYLKGNPIDNYKPIESVYPSMSSTDFEILPAPVQFSRPGGFYQHEFYLELTSPDADATIYYTLDGSQPTLESPVYSAPIHIHSRAGETNRLSAVPLNYRTDYLAWKPPLEEVFKATVVKAMAYSEMTRSPVSTHTYFVDEQMQTRYSVPVISISTDPAHLLDGSEGLFVNNNFLNRGREWEREVDVEFYEADGQLGFAQKLGMRIHGSSSREAPTKSLRFYARNDYGQPAITYPLFPDKEIDVFHRFLLRYRGTDFKDAFQSRLVADDTDLDLQASRPVIVFINGEYWGVYQLRDRIDDRYFATHYGITDIDLLENMGDVKEGDSIHYFAMLDDIRSNENNMNDPVVYDRVRSQMDVENFRDFHIVQNFVMNLDQPGKNMDFWRSRTIDPDHPKQDGRWRWILFDLDIAYGSYGGLGMNGFVYSTSLRHHGDEEILSGEQMAALMPRLPDFSPPRTPMGPETTYLLRTMLKNDRFRHDYINRFADLLNTAFKPDRVHRIIDQMQAEFAPLVEENALRSGQLDEGQFENQVNILRDFTDRRPHYVRAAAVDYFAEITGIAELTLETNEQQGSIQVNTIELSQDRGWQNGPIFPWTGTYFTSIPIKVTAIPKAGYSFVRWEGDLTSPSAELTFAMENDMKLKAVFKAQ